METACDILFGYRGYIYIKRYFKITSIRFLVTFVWLTSPCEYFFFFSCLLMTKICILMAVDEIIVNLLKLIVFIFKNLLRYYTNIINSSILEIERERNKSKICRYIYIFILSFKRYKSDSGKVFPLRKARSKSSSIPSRLHTIGRDAKAFRASRTLVKLLSKLRYTIPNLAREDITSRHVGKYSGQNILQMEIVKWWIMGVQ